MAFKPSPAVLPPSRTDPEDPRFLELFGAELEAADLLLAGVPHDTAVIGRRGARKGPTGIREAMRFLSNHDPTTGHSLAGRRFHDAGDVAALPDDVLATHAIVRDDLRTLFEHSKPTVLLGGDHGLTYAHVAALCDEVQGPVGVVVLDAHYDLRAYEGQPTSGTPFRRILTELGGRVRGANLAEVGIRPYANTKQLADYAAQQEVRVWPMDAVWRDGVDAVAEAALEAASDGVEHLWLSVDIDGLDQSVASGCSAPGAGGLSFREADHLVRAVAGHPLCRGMDVMEVAPELDPTGNTCRTAAQLVAAFAGTVLS